MKSFLYLWAFLLPFLIASCADANTMESEKDPPGTRTLGISATNAYNINEELGRGINMNNTFETNAFCHTCSPEYFESIAAKGFNHVRIPIHWETRVSPNTNTIDIAFIERIKKVIDEALKHDLYVIINMHNHKNLMNNPGRYYARFLSQWKQIAEAFHSYPDKLLFEILNEPNGRMTPTLWNQALREVQPLIRESNPNRILLVGTAYGGGINGLNRLDLPANDGNMIVTLHYYNPFEFTHQGAGWVGSISKQWDGTEWHGTEAERMNIEFDLKQIKAFETNIGLPIHIGEFGAYGKADMDSRVRWTNYVARRFEHYGFSWAYRELSSQTGMYNVENDVVPQQLLEALTRNLISKAAPYQNFIPYYKSDFSVSNDNWELLADEDVEVNLTRRNKKLVVNIAKTGSKPGNIQLVKDIHNLPVLEKGEQYLITFKVSSASANGIVTGPYSRYYQSYIGQNHSPWRVYSHIKSFATGENEDTYGYLFKMEEDPDDNGRIVFDLGKTPGVFILSNFTVSKVEV